MDETPTVLYDLAARNLYTYYKADVHAYVMVMQISTTSFVGGSAAPTIALPSWQILHAVNDCCATIWMRMAAAIGV
jgi:hypothetical protein